MVADFASYYIYSKGKEEPNSNELFFSIATHSKNMNFSLASKHPFSPQSSLSRGHHWKATQYILK